MYLSKENFKFSSLTRYFFLTRRNWKEEKQDIYNGKIWYFISLEAQTLL